MRVVGLIFTDKFFHSSLSHVQWGDKIRVVKYSKNRR